MNLTRTASALAVATLVAATAAGCSTFGDLFAEDAVRDDDTNEVVEGGSVDIFSIAPGDCIADNLEDTEYSTVSVVPCSEPHDGEVYFTYTFAESEYPGDDVIQSTGDEQCYDAFEDFIGIPWDESAYYYGYFYPNQTTWDENDDREIDCYVYDETGQVTGTLEGVAS